MSGQVPVEEAEEEDVLYDYATDVAGDAGDDKVLLWDPQDGRKEWIPMDASRCIHLNHLQRVFPGATGIVGIRTLSNRRFKLSMSGGRILPPTKGWSTKDIMYIIITNDKSYEEVAINMNAATEGDYDVPPGGAPVPVSPSDPIAQLDQCLASRGDATTLSSASASPSVLRIVDHIRAVVKSPQDMASLVTAERDPDGEFTGIKYIQPRLRALLGELGVTAADLSDRRRARTVHNFVAKTAWMVTREKMGGGGTAAGRPPSLAEDVYRTTTVPASPLAPTERPPTMYGTRADPDKPVVDYSTEMEPRGLGCLVCFPSGLQTRFRDSFRRQGQWVRSSFQGVRRSFGAGGGGRRSRTPRGPGGGGTSSEHMGADNSASETPLTRRDSDRSKYETINTRRQPELTETTTTYVKSPESQGLTPRPMRPPPPSVLTTEA